MYVTTPTVIKMYCTSPGLHWNQSLCFLNTSNGIGSTETLITSTGI